MFSAQPALSATDRACCCCLVFLFPRDLQTLDRSSVCYDQNASVVVQITDLCKCYYPQNAYSNKRW